MFSESFRDLDSLRVWYLCKQLWHSFWKKLWAWFPGLWITDNPLWANHWDWWARKGQSTEPDTGSCTTGAVQSAGQSIG